MTTKTLGIVVALAFGALWSPIAAVGQELILVTRHADPQIREGAPIADDTPLSELGRRQADTLVERLKDAGITAIYTTDILRTIQTAQPLAEALGVSIATLPRQDIDGLVRRLRRDHGEDRVLVVGHTGTLPKILRALGHAEEVEIVREIRNNLFVVVPQCEGPPVVAYLHY